METKTRIFTEMFLKYYQARLMTDIKLVSVILEFILMLEWIDDSR